MDVRILDLDGGLTDQLPYLPFSPGVHNLRAWGPRLRLGCRFGRYAHFEKDLATRLGPTDDGPGMTFIGSGDFHHVSLALLRRRQEPFNLLVIDNHPDWMRGIPLMHCGTWLWHAARLPQVGHIFHVGGDVDFDNYYRWMAPWPLLRSGRLTVFPAIRPYLRRPWPGVPTPPLRTSPDEVMPPERIEELLDPFRIELARRPLYVSLDKDVMTTADAVVNWDSGHLCLAEVQMILSAFLAAAGRLESLDVVGDWSPVRVSGTLRHFLHLTEHPPLDIDPVEAARRNARTNADLLTGVVSAAGGGSEFVSYAA